MKSLWMLFIFTCELCFADIIGTKGSIDFDVHNDGQAELILNSTGLGIGTLPSTNLTVNGNSIISNQLNVGGMTGASNLNLQGTLGFSLQTISSNALLGHDSIVLVDSSSDNLVLTLPYAGNVSGQLYSIKKTSLSNEVLIKGGGAIDGKFSLPLTSGNLGYVQLISIGSQYWSILSISGNGELSDYEYSTNDGSDGVSGFVRYNMASTFNGSSVIIKNSGATSTFTRKGYLRFDLSDLNVTASDARLDLAIEINDGAHNHTVFVYGLLDESLDNWDPTTTLYANAPANDLSSGTAADTTSGNAIFIDSFTITPADTIGAIKSLSGANLANFINTDTNGNVTLIIGRSSNDSNENIGFSSESDANPPKLTIVP